MGLVTCCVRHSPWHPPHTQAPASSWTRVKRFLGKSWLFLLNFLRPTIPLWLAQCMNMHQTLAKHWQYQENSILGSHGHDGQMWNQPSKMQCFKCCNFAQASVSSYPKCQSLHIKREEILLPTSVWNQLLSTPGTKSFAQTQALSCSERLGVPSSAVLRLKEEWMQGVLLPARGWWCYFTAKSQGGRGGGREGVTQAFDGHWLLCSGPQTSPEVGRICLPLPLFTPSQVIAPCISRVGRQDAEGGESTEQPGMVRAQWRKDSWWHISKTSLLHSATGFHHIYQSKPEVLPRLRSSLSLSNLHWCLLNTRALKQLETNLTLRPSFSILEHIRVCVYMCVLYSVCVFMCVCVTWTMTQHSLCFLAEHGLRIFCNLG